VALSQELFFGVEIFIKDNLLLLLLEGHVGDDGLCIDLVLLFVGFARS
jgi:hypothetical protein